MRWSVRGRAPVVEGVRQRLAAGTNVVVAGSAGVGKTALAREVAEDLDGCWVVGSPALRPIPLGAFAHLLDAEEPLAPDDPLTAVRGAASAVEHSGAELLVVDDLPLLDGRSLALVHLLFRRGRVPVLATVRDRFDAPAEVQDLWKDGSVEVVDLRPLGSDDVADLLGHVLPGPVEAGLPGRLHDLTGGNALLLREAVESGLDDGSLREVDGRWSWAGVRQPSSGLVDAVRSRLAPLGDDAVDAGDLLAMGEPVPVDVLAAAAGREAVEALESGGVVVVDEASGVVRFSHPLYGEVIAASLGVARRQRLWTALADALEPSAASATDRLRVARWRLGGGGAWAPERWVDAADAANRRFDHALAEELARRAVDDGGGFHAQLALASALVGTGQLDAAHALLEGIGDGATTDEERMDHAVASYHARSASVGFRSDFAADLERTEAAMDEPDNRRFVAAQRATLLCFAGDLVGGRRVVDDLLAELGDRTDPAAATVRLRLAVPLGTSSILSGRTREATDYCSTQLPISLGLTDRVPAGPVWCATTLMYGLVTGGRLEEAEDVLGLLRSVAEGGDWSEWFREQADEFITSIEGMILMARGHVPVALGRLAPLLVAGSGQAFSSHLIIEGAAAIGDVDLARRIADGIDEVGRTWPAYEEIALLARVWADVAAGEVSSAGGRAVEAMGSAVGRGRLTVAAHLGHAAVRLGRAAEVADAMGEIETSTDIAPMALMVAHARAAAVGDGAALEEVGAGFADIGFLLLAAEAYDGARIAHWTRDRAGDAQRAGAASSTLLERCGGFRPTWLGVVDAPTPLTRREDEVVKLAAQGLSNNVIAERLHVSTRTVEGHLLRAYPKLGVRSRDELARLVAPGPDHGR